MIIRLRIRELAEAQKLTQGLLSRKANVDPTTLRRIYHDPYTIITTETLAKLATALSLPSSELLEDVPNEQAQAERLSLQK